MHKDIHKFSTKIEDLSTKSVDNPRESPLYIGVGICSYPYDEELIHNPSTEIVDYFAFSVSFFFIADRIHNGKGCDLVSPFSRSIILTP